MSEIRFTSVYGTPMELVREPDGDDQGEVLLRIFTHEFGDKIQAEVYIFPDELVEHLKAITGGA